MVHPSNSIFFKRIGKRRIQIFFSACEKCLPKEMNNNKNIFKQLVSNVVSGL